MKKKIKKPAIMQGWIIKDHPGEKHFIQMDALGSKYTEATLEALLSGRRVHISKRSRTKYTWKQIKLLIGIEVKLRAGKGKVYERCAEKHNIDTLARSTIYLKVASPPLSALCPLLLGD